MHAMHQLRAEHTARSGAGSVPGPGGVRGAGAAGVRGRARHQADLGPVKVWHMVRGVDGSFDTTAMCGRDLHPAAAARPAEEWGTTREPMCHACGALYLREVP